MSKCVHPKTVYLTGSIVLLTVMAFGLLSAFSKGANDFSVFYEAWHLVLAGRGLEIYKVSPDRFLYGPGFAWILAPFSMLPKSMALALWCAAKVCVVGYIVREFSRRLNLQNQTLALGLSIWGMVFVARPILIDFSYGQVNLFVLGACVWALLGRTRSDVSIIGDLARWSVLTWVALSKLFPLPLLAIPWFVAPGISKNRIRNEKLGILLGFGVVFLPPLLSVGWVQGWELLSGWRDALISRGLPLESHNQSFTAFLYHYLSGFPTHILSEGYTPLLLGWSGLSINQIGLMSLAWTTLVLGVLLGWIFSGARQENLKWAAVTIGLLIVPSHLIWKPYFVMSIPLTILFVHRVYSQGGRALYGIAAALFVGINLTGFDFVGHIWAAHMEASSVLLLMHIVLIFLVASGRDSAIQLS